MSDVRVEIKFKNARLWNAIAARSGPLKDDARIEALWTINGPIRAWCVSEGIQPNAVYQLLSLRKTPYRKDRSGRLSWRPVASRLAQLLDTTEAELFPVELYESTVNKIVTDVLDRFVALSAARYMVLPPEGESDLILDDRKTAIATALATLPPRLQTIIALRFGLEDGQEHTLTDVGKMIGVSQERCRQLESRALTKLRHPRRSKALEEFT